VVRQRGPRALRLSLHRTLLLQSNLRNVLSIRHAVQSRNPTSAIMSASAHQGVGAKEKIQNNAQTAAATIRKDQIIPRATNLRFQVIRFDLQRHKLRGQGFVHDLEE
jgi:hypothetical protein